MLDTEGLFRGFAVGESMPVWMSHGDHVNVAPAGFIVTASSENTPVAAMRHASRPIHCVQFHPEVHHSPRGGEVIDNFLFAPESVSVTSGATVTWINCEPAGTEPHTTTSAASTPLWDSGEFPSGDRYSHTFNTPGVYPYFCTSHSGMNGVVVVQ